MPAHRSIIKTKKGTIYIASGNKIVYFLWVASISQGSFDNILFDLFCFHPIGLHAIQFDDAKSTLKSAKKLQFWKVALFCLFNTWTKSSFWNSFEQSSEEIFSKSLKYCTVFPLLEYIVECATYECSMIRKTWIWLVLYYYVCNDYS